MRGDENWRSRVGSMAPGEHFLLWSDGSPSSISVLEMFIRGGLARGDLIVIAVPRSEHETLHEQMRARGLELDSLIARELLLLLAAEDWSPHDASDEDSVASFLGALSDVSAGRGKVGLTYLGRIAPWFFEIGDLPISIMVERVLHVRRGSARILCPYDLRSLTLQHLGEASSLLSSHTHTMTARGQDRFLVEETR